MDEEPDDELIGRVYPLVKQVTDGRGLDVFATKKLLADVLGEHEYAWEVDRVVRWLSRLLGPTAAVPPFSVRELVPLAEVEEFRRRHEGLPSAAELYATVRGRAPLPEGFSALVARIAPYLAGEQVRWLLAQDRTDWRPQDLARLHHVAEVNRRVGMIASSYGGLAFLPQSLAISLFLGEALAMGEPSEGAPEPPVPLATGLLGPAAAAVLLQAGLASVAKARTSQRNQRLLLDHVLAQPPDYLRAVLVELSGRSPRVLAGLLYALLGLEQRCCREPLDLVAELSSRLETVLPRLSDYLAGGSKARLGYYKALNNAAELILRESEPWLALKAHLQQDRRPVPPRPVEGARLRPLAEAARGAIREADALGARCRFSGRDAPRQRRARQAYEEAFAACRRLLDAEPHAFQLPWFKEFWARNHEALVVLSVVDNVRQHVDDVRRWLRVRTGAPIPRGTQALVEAVVGALYHFEDDRARLLADPLVRLLIAPPAGRYDFTVVSAMGVVTEGARGTELSAAYDRLRDRRGVEVIRADTETFFSLEHNARRIRQAAAEARGPWGYVGYSQGCANALQAEAELVSGTPDQQALAARLRCRNLLFSSFNGSAHGTCSDRKLLRAIDDGERFLKHYQGVFSRRAIELAQGSLQQLMDSRLFVNTMLSSESLSHEGVWYLQREGQFVGHAPTSIVRGVVTEEILPEALEWLANVLARQVEHGRHDTQVTIEDAVGHPRWVRNAQAALLRRCDMGCLVQATHHWSPLLAETEFITTERDRARGIYDFPKDRHVVPWVEVNARFGVIGVAKKREG